jgi:hypothetical protein
MKELEEIILQAMQISIMVGVIFGVLSGIGVIILSLYREFK